MYYFQVVVRMLSDLNIFLHVMTTILSGPIILFASYRTNFISIKHFRFGSKSQEQGKDTYHTSCRKELATTAKFITIDTSCILRIIKLTPLQPGLVFQFRYDILFKTLNC